MGLISAFDFRSQEDVVNVQITHEKPEKFVDKVSLRSHSIFFIFSLINLKMSLANWLPAV